MLPAVGARKVAQNFTFHVGADWPLFIGPDGFAVEQRLNHFVHDRWLLVGYLTAPNGQQHVRRDCNVEHDGCKASLAVVCTQPAGYGRTRGDERNKFANSIKLCQTIRDSGSHARITAACPLATLGMLREEPPLLTHFACSLAVG